MIAFKTPYADGGRDVLDFLIMRIRDNGYSVEDKKHLPLLMGTEGARRFEEEKAIYNLYVAANGDMFPILNIIQTICKALNITPKLYHESIGGFEELEYLLVEL
jgi:hypothetical protein